MKIKILDIGISNLQSVINAFESINKTILICEDHKDIKNGDAFVLPGVGSFDFGMKSLIEKNYIDALNNEVINKNKPILGICLGMQLLFTCGYENDKETDGLGFADGEVKKMKIHDFKNYKLPHVGWNDVKILNNNGLFKDIKDGTDFYFIHSFYAQPVNKNIISALSNNSVDFMCAFEKDNIFGVQFHPEKSQKSGLQLLKNWCELI